MVTSVKSLTPPDSHHLNAALGWLGLGNWKEADEELEQITQANRVHPDVLTVRLEVYVKAGKWDLAADVAKTLRDSRPKEPRYWISLAYATRRKQGGGLKKAKEILLQAHRIFAREPTIAFNLACYECQLGDLKEAWKWLEIAFEVGNAQEWRLKALKDKDLEPLWGRIGGTV